MASTERKAPQTTLIERWAQGILPEWAVVTPRRREHMARVAALLNEWAAGLGLTPTERNRWLAAGWLHDALRDADPEILRRELPTRFAGLPAPLLHGPAAAERLQTDADAELCDAVRYHTVGHPGFGPLGRALYLADFLDPGRDFLRNWRAALRDRMPHDLDAVLQEVLAARLEHLIRSRKPIRPETAAFWSAVVGDHG